MATLTMPREAVAAKTTMRPLFPFLDLQAQFATIRSDVMAAVERVLDSQHFILGPEVEALEREIAEYTGAEFAVGCASGSDALLLALMALEIGSGDEVITTPFTFGATAGAIARLQARPVFVDIDPVTFNLDVDQLEAAITPRTRAIMPVHLFGLSAEMDRIGEIARDREIAVIEDAAQAIGSRYKGQAIGSIGTFGCFSFFPSKNLGYAGDGGIVTTNDAALAQQLRMLRAHGTRKKYRYECLGVNSRLDALQAAILRVKLQRLDEWTDGRRRNAERYRELFREFELTDVVSLPIEPTDRFHVYNQFVVRAADRDALQAHLASRGIPTEIYYPGALHLQPAYEWLGHGEGDFPEAERACRESLALPIFTELRSEQQRAVVAAVADFYRTRS